MPTATLDIAMDDLKQVCNKHHVQRLQLFGSTVRGENCPESDVDLLVEYKHGFTPTFFNLEELESDLSRLFNGRRIDMARPDDIHWFIKRSVLSSARTLYEG